MAPAAPVEVRCQVTPRTIQWTSPSTQPHKNKGFYGARICGISVTNLSQSGWNFPHFETGSPVSQETPPSWATRGVLSPQTALNYAVEDGERTWLVSGLSAILMGNNKNSERFAHDVHRETVSGELALPSGYGEQDVSTSGAAGKCSKNKRKYACVPFGAFFQSLSIT